MIKNINWKVRVKNKQFWIFIIPALLLLVQQVLAIFGVTLDLTDLQNQLIAIVGTVFTILALLGIVNDPTTPTISDSERAQTYVLPGKPYEEPDKDVCE